MADKLAEWWDEEAERLNAMADEAHKAGVTIKVGKTLKPPVLAKDGSLVKTTTKTLGELMYFIMKTVKNLP